MAKKNLDKRFTADKYTTSTGKQTKESKKALNNLLKKTKGK